MDDSLLQLSDANRERMRRAIRRWSPIVVLGALLAGATSLVVSLSLKPEYVATAQLYIAPASNPTVAFQDVVLGQNVARSYVQLVTSDVVLKPAATQMNWTDLKEFRERVQATQVRDTTIINVSFRDSAARTAAEAANAVVDSFIAQSRALQSSLQGTTASQLDAQIDSLQRDISSLDAEIAGLRAEIAATARPGSSAPPKAEQQSQLSQLDFSRQTKQQTLAQLLKTRDDMRLAAVRAESTVTLWQPAVPPDEPVSPRVPLNVALGVVSGGLVTALVILLMSYVGDRITDYEQVQARLGVPPMAQVHMSERAETLAGKLFVRDQPTAPVAEAFRALRTNIQFASVDAQPRSLVVTSALPGEGKSVVAANLAMALAEAGTPTILVDADLRRPSQHKLFGLSARFGLTTLLTGTEVSLESFRVSSGLVVIPSGPLPPNPAQLLASARMSTLIRDLSGYRERTFVLIDTSPVLAVADAIGLATRVDGCLVVVDSSGTRASAALHAVDALRRARARVLGVVLNKVSAAEGAPYYYYGRYGSQQSQQPGSHGG